MSGHPLSCLSCHATLVHERNMKFQVSNFKLKTGNLLSSLFNAYNLKFEA